MKHTYKIALLGAFTLILGISVMVLSMSHTLAQDGGDSGPNLPTPTGFPVENVSYELSEVGGEDITLTFPGIEQDGITISETVVESNYPRGMIFTMSTDSENGEIVDAILFVRLISGSNVRFQGIFDEASNAWTARPWETGDGQPAWTPFEFIWRVRDDTDAFIETEPTAVDYWDPTRRWWRMESDDVVLYWFGFEEVDPEYVAENAAYAVAATEPRRAAGFGGPISYKPVGVIYPTRETLGETTGSGQTDSNAAGFTRSGLGMTVQHISVPTDDWFERQAECIYLTPREERTEQLRVDRTIFGTIPHEIAHLYQYDKGVALGPNWWVEGQADYFTYQAGLYDARIRYLSTLQDIDTLENNIGWRTFEADGCYALAYDMGVSFINWLLTNYGGIETHAQIVNRIERNFVLQDAIEDVVGKPFNELQNEWRVYLGYAPFSETDLDPSLALVEAIDPLYQVGDVFTVPFPNMAVYADPAPTQISVARCFGNLQAEVLQVGNGNGVNYYQVDCSGIQGWVPEAEMPTP